MENGNREIRARSYIGRSLGVAIVALVLLAGCSGTPPTNALTSLTNSANPGNSLSCYKDDRRMVRPGLYKVCMMDRGRMTCLNPC